MKKCLMFALIAMNLSAFAAFWVGGGKLVNRYPWFDTSFYLADIHGEVTSPVWLRAQFNSAWPDAVSGFEITPIDVGGKTVQINDLDYSVTVFRYASVSQLCENVTGEISMRMFEGTKGSWVSRGGSLNSQPFDTRFGSITCKTHADYVSINLNYCPTAWGEDSGSRRVVLAVAPLDPATKTPCGPYVKLLSSTERGIMTLHENAASPKKAGLYQLLMKTLYREYKVELNLEPSCFAAE